MCSDEALPHDRDGGAMHPDRRIARITARQHGVLTKTQARGCGLSDGAIKYRVRTGRWRIFAPGIYIVQDVPRTWEQEVMAAVLAAGEGAAASHIAAGALLGFLERDRRRIDVTVARGRRDGRPRAFRVHRARSFDRSDVVSVHGIRVVCPARTLVDLAGVLQDAALEAALDTALLKGRISIPALRGYVRDRCLGHQRGVGALMKLLDDREHGVPESELERGLLRIVKRFRLPELVRQHREVRFRVDFAYVRERVIVEVDGRATHGTAEAFREDPRRQNQLVLEGWTILRFTWDDVKNRPDDVASIIRMALCRASSGS